MLPRSTNAAPTSTVMIAITESQINLVLASTASNEKKISYGHRDKAQLAVKRKVVTEKASPKHAKVAVGFIVWLDLSFQRLLGTHNQAKRATPTITNAKPSCTSRR